MHVGRNAVGSTLRASRDKHERELACCAMPVTRVTLVWLHRCSMRARKQPMDK